MALTGMDKFLIACGFGGFAWYYWYKRMWNYEQPGFAGFGATPNAKAARQARIKAAQEKRRQQKAAAALLKGQKKVRVPKASMNKLALVLSQKFGGNNVKMFMAGAPNSAFADPLKPAQIDSFIKSYVVESIAASGQEPKQAFAVPFSKNYSIMIGPDAFVGPPAPDAVKSTRVDTPQLATTPLADQGAVPDMSMFKSPGHGDVEMAQPLAAPQDIAKVVAAGPLAQGALPPLPADPIVDKKTMDLLSKGLGLLGEMGRIGNAPIDPNLASIRPDQNFRLVSQDSNGLTQAQNKAMITLQSDLIAIGMKLAAFQKDAAAVMGKSGATSSQKPDEVSQLVSTIEDTMRNGFGANLMAAVLNKGAKTEQTESGSITLVSDKVQQLLEAKEALRTTHATVNSYALGKINMAFDYVKEYSMKIQSGLAMPGIAAVEAALKGMTWIGDGISKAHMYAEMGKAVVPFAALAYGVYSVQDVLRESFFPGSTMGPYMQFSSDQIRGQMADLAKGQKSALAEIDRRSQATEQNRKTGFKRALRDMDSLDKTTASKLAQVKKGLPDIDSKLAAFDKEYRIAVNERTYEAKLNAERWQQEWKYQPTRTAEFFNAIGQVALTLQQPYRASTLRERLKLKPQQRPESATASGVFGPIGSAGTQGQTGFDIPRLDGPSIDRVLAQVQAQNNNITQAQLQTARQGLEEQRIDGLNETLRNQILASLHATGIMAAAYGPLAQQSQKSSMEYKDPGDAYYNQPNVDIEYYSPGGSNTPKQFDSGGVPFAQPMPNFSLPYAEPTGNVDVYANLRGLGRLSMLGRLTRAQRIKQRAAAREKRRSAPAFAIAAPVSSFGLTSTVPTQTAASRVSPNDPQFGHIQGAMIVSLPWVRIPTPESLTIDGVAQYPNGYYKEVDRVLLKPGVGALDYINAKQWAERNYRPVSGSEAIMTQSISKMY